MTFKWSYEIERGSFFNSTSNRTSVTKLQNFICFNVVIFYYSTPELVLRDQGRCCPPQDPVWRTSAPHRSSNATATANATIMPPHTASGWAPLQATLNSPCRNQRHSRLGHWGHESVDVPYASEISKPYSTAKPSNIFLEDH